MSVVFALNPLISVVDQFASDSPFLAAFVLALWDHGERGLLSDCSGVAPVAVPVFRVLDGIDERFVGGCAERERLEGNSSYQ